MSSKCDLAIIGPLTPPESHPLDAGQGSNRWPTDIDLKGWTLFHLMDFTCFQVEIIKFKLQEKPIRLCGRYILFFKTYHVNHDNQHDFYQQRNFYHDFWVGLFPDISAHQLKTLFCRKKQIELAKRQNPCVDCVGTSSNAAMNLCNYIYIASNKSISGKLLETDSRPIEKKELKFLESSV